MTHREGKHGPVLVLALCLGWAVSPLASAADEGGSRGAAASNVKSTEFVVFGDAGTGLPPQYAVGEAMAQVCAARGCRFGIEVGDNFYPSGVTKVDDPQFQDKFEKPYAPLDFPIYVALGNHDTGLNGSASNNERGDVQVEYSNSGRSTKFRMPARYYHFTVPPNAGEGKPPFAEFFALDSSPILASGKDNNPAMSPQVYGEKQMAWFEQALSQSTARWKIAFAHHPYISNGVSGNAGQFAHPKVALPTASGPIWRELLDRTVCHFGVDLFFAGHSHDMEWLKSVPACGKTQFLISGLGGGGPSDLSARNKSNWQATQTYGFFWLRLKRQKMTIAAYTLTPDLKLPLDKNGHPLPAFEKTVSRH
jgi:tartrate-resistant acid phosphatase type 5